MLLFGWGCSLSWVLLLNSMCRCVCVLFRLMFLWVLLGGRLRLLLFIDRCSLLFMCCVVMCRWL